MRASISDLKGLEDEMGTFGTFDVGQNQAFRLIGRSGCDRPIPLISSLLSSIHKSGSFVFFVEQLLMPVLIQFGGQHSKLHMCYPTSIYFAQTRLGPGFLLRELLDLRLE